MPLQSIVGALHRASFASAGRLAPAAAASRTWARTFFDYFTRGLEEDQAAVFVPQDAPERACEIARGPGALPKRPTGGSLRIVDLAPQRHTLRGGFAYSRVVDPVVTAVLGFPAREHLRLLEGQLVQGSGDANLLGARWGVEVPILATPRDFREEQRLVLVSFGPTALLRQRAALLKELVGYQSAAAAWAAQDPTLMSVYLAQAAHSERRAAVIDDLLSDIASPV